MDNLASMLGAVIPDGSEAMVIYTDPTTNRVAVSFHPEEVDVVRCVGMLEIAKHLVQNAVGWEDEDDGK